MGEGFLPGVTIRAVYEPAMRITNQRAADAYLLRLVRHHMSFGFSRQEAEAVEKYNLNYFAGFYDDATRERVRLLFGCATDVLLANCVGCRRRMCLYGPRKQYWQCRYCKYVILREGEKKKHHPPCHLASCRQCRNAMRNLRRGGIVTSFYCTRCKWATRTELHRPPPVMNKQLHAFIASLLPGGLSDELREEVVSDIALAILRTRHTQNGYRLTPRQIDTKRVRRFIQDARRRIYRRFYEVSIHDGEFPLSERLAG